jgi:diguanylate cyclase (GGDEF)-like protein
LIFFKKNIQKKYNILAVKDHLKLKKEELTVVTLNYSDLLMNNNHFYKNNTNIPLPASSIFLDKLQCGVFILDKHWSIKYLNKSLEKWLGKGRNELLGYYLLDVLPAVIDTKCHFSLQKAMKYQTSITYEDIYKPTREWLKITAEPYNDGIIGYVTNITEKKLLEQTIKEFAYFDDLTVLPNRKSFEENIKKFKYSSDKNELKFALIYTEIYLSNNIESIYNYIYADQLYNKFGTRLLSLLDYNCFLARIDGNEFALLTYLTDIASLEGLVKDIKKSLNDTPFNVNDIDFYISANQGIAIYPSHGGDSETLIINAQKALIKAKQIGNNNYSFFSPNKKV